MRNFIIFTCLLPVICFLLTITYNGLVSYQNKNKPTSKYETNIETNNDDYINNDTDSEVPYGKYIDYNSETFTPLSGENRHIHSFYDTYYKEMVNNYEDCTYNDGVCIYCSHKLVN